MINLPTDVSGLKNFKKRLDDKSRKLKSGEIAKAVAEFGVEIARNEWSGQDVNVYAEQKGLTSYDVVAEGEGIAYLEYGVGSFGINTYLGQLPSRWEYNYDSPYKAVAKTGKYAGMTGWFTTKAKDHPSFEVGHSAGNYMYVTAREMERKIRELGFDTLR